MVVLSIDGYPKLDHFALHILLCLVQSFVLLFEVAAVTVFDTCVTLWLDEVWQN